MSRIGLACGLAVLWVSAAGLQPVLMLQSQSAARTPEFLRQRLEDFARRSKAAEDEGLSHPFKGITTNGQIARISCGCPTCSIPT